MSNTYTEEEINAANILINLCAGAGASFNPSDLIKTKKEKIHPMKLRSSKKKNKHLDSWDILTHYGMCGETCPCCRALFDKALGACVICQNK
jgi:hypothetical protein